MSIGLVLEGGAMRGLYTAGVLDVFLDNNIKVDGIIGVSAGVLFGVNYLSKQKGRAIRYNKKFAKDKKILYGVLSTCALFMLCGAIAVTNVPSKQLADYNITKDSNTSLIETNTQDKEKGSASNFPVVRPCEPLCGRLKGWVGQLPQQGFSRRIGNGGGQVTWLALPAAVRKKAEKICIMLCLSRYGTSRWTVDPPTLAFQSTDGRKSP